MLQSGGSLPGGGQIMVPSHLRFAAGVCVLVAGLLMGAPEAAVSFAKPPSSDTTAHSGDGTNDSDQQPTTKKKKTSGGTDTKEGKRNSGKQPSTGTTSQTNAPDGADATDETTDSGPVAGAATSGTGATPLIAGSTSEAGAAAVGAEAITFVTAATATPVTDVVAPAPDVEPAMPISDVPVASVSEGITWTQDMLTLVFGTVVSLTQLQSDLYSFLMGIAGAAPVVEVAGLSSAGDASVASQWPLMPPLAAIQGVPVADNAVGVAHRWGMAPYIFGAIEIGRNAIPMGEQSFFGYARNDLLLPASQSAQAAGALSGAAGLAILTAAGVLPVSLVALALIALPGAGGLITLTAAGVRIGYPQAKAGCVFRAAGIAGFARPGPLGVVRSGSLVVIHPRAVARRWALSAGDPFHRVA